MVSQGHKTFVVDVLAIYGFLIEDTRVLSSNIKYLLAKQCYTVDFLIDSCLSGCKLINKKLQQQIKLQTKI